MFIDTWLGKVQGPARPRVRPGSVVSADAPIPFAGPPTPEINPVARWAIGLHGADRKPYAVLHCTCKTDTIFELPGNGTAPRPNCCKNAPPYPNDEEHQRHLWQTGTAANGSFLGCKARAGLVPEIPPSVVPDSGAQHADGILTHDELVALTKMIDADLKGAEKDADAVASALPPK
jgi:hypothetical protein